MKPDSLKVYSEEMRRAYTVYTFMEELSNFFAEQLKSLPACKYSAVVPGHMLDESGKCISCGEYIGND